jgi:UDP-N-acetylglucosamine--N-acetylmuramyl-(pentapeptide) pyrophosphoryl-undecaprenol N-acetylglucosamine transferase
MKKILIMAGGTGGHVFPGLAVAAELQQSGHQVEWLGTQHGLDTVLVPKANIPLHKVRIKGLRGKGKLGLVTAPFKISKAILESLRILNKVQPDVVLGMGGYVAGPGGIACWLKRIPLIIHEQNAIPGKTNMLLSRFAKRCLQAFPNSFPHKINALTVGNPIRRDVCAIVSPQERLQVSADKLKVLVFGGSQGAEAINRCLLQLLQTDFAKQHLSVWHQVGKNNYAAVQEQYQQHEITAKVVPFIDDMSNAYAWADLVICRAGALSVSEIAAAGLASILIPFPAAVDDHQTANAQFLQRANAALIIQEKELTTEKLLEILQKFSNNRSQLISMAINARQQAKPDATQRVVEICLQDTK